MIYQYVYKLYISVGICIEIAKKYTYQPEYVYKVYISIPTDVIVDIRINRTLCIGEVRKPRLPWKESEVRKPHLPGWVRFGNLAYRGKKVRLGNLTYRVGFG